MPRFVSYNTANTPFSRCGLRQHTIPPIHPHFLIEIKSGTPTYTIKNRHIHHRYTASHPKGQWKSTG